MSPAEKAKLLTEKQLAALRVALEGPLTRAFAKERLNIQGVAYSALMLSLRARTLLTEDYRITDHGRDVIAAADVKSAPPVNV